MDPPVPNLGEPGQGPVLEEGMALAVEPLLVLGGPDTVLLDDGWTVVSADGTPSAHFEHTVAITADGPWVLTAPDGGRDWFSRLAQAAAGPAGGRADSGLADSAARPQA
jgi:methionyl aminopeptidase